MAVAPPVVQPATLGHVHLDSIRFFLPTERSADTLTDLELLRDAIRLSGLSVSRFAREIMVRSPSCVYAWLAGGSIPRVARDKLQSYVATVTPGTPMEGLGTQRVPG